MPCPFSNLVSSTIHLDISSILIYGFVRKQATPSMIDHHFPHLGNFDMIVGCPKKRLDSQLIGPSSQENLQTSLLSLGRREPVLHVPRDVLYGPTWWSPWKKRKKTAGYISYPSIYRKHGGIMAINGLPWYSNMAMEPNGDPPLLNWKIICKSPVSLAGSMVISYQRSYGCTRIIQLQLLKELGLSWLIP